MRNQVSTDSNNNYKTNNKRFKLYDKRLGKRVKLLYKLDNDLDH